MIKFDAKKFARLISAIMVCQFAGLFGSIFTTPAIPTWYAGLQRPEFSPPNWLFAPVWIILYTLMGISLFLIWDKGLKEKESKIAVSVFGAQLALNAIWSFLFFGLRSPFYAFIEIIVLWLAIAATIVLFYKISKTAAWLMVPYIIWVSIAAFLNYSIWILNF